MRIQGTQVPPVQLSKNRAEREFLDESSHTLPLPSTQGPCEVAVSERKDCQRCGHPSVMRPHKCCTPDFSVLSASCIAEKMELSTIGDITASEKLTKSVLQLYAKGDPSSLRNAKSESSTLGVLWLVQRIYESY